MTTGTQFLNISALTKEDCYARDWVKFSDALNPVALIDFN
ncbi:hypothetical protein MICAE_1240014 [Microcystis aeruginosa PCC 9806]|uniref:Uncharacterized protein n=1 Tax=Microcystis aeruginosa PCC 9806 TaxID=1160282 RepID=I4GRB8_MICAE|nr:hypothetical protein MICAE_1240014 [Microcystis aeruginosa PCC 9806]